MNWQLVSVLIGYVAWVALSLVVMLLGRQRDWARYRSMLVFVTGYFVGWGSKWL